MRYLKTYEKITKLSYNKYFGYKYWEERTKLAASAMEYYLDINSEESNYNIGFCVIEDWNLNGNDFIFQFYNPIDKELLEKFYNFLNEHNLEVHLKEDKKDYTLFHVTVTSQKVNELADFYEAIKKYNI